MYERKVHERRGTLVPNFLGSVFSLGAFSRSAVNHNAGVKTAVSNIVMSVTVMVTLLFLMPLFQYTPNAVLGVIIVTAVIGLIDIPAAYAIWKIDKFDFVVMLCAFLGVIFISVQDGLAVAVSFGFSSISREDLGCCSFLELVDFHNKGANLITSQIIHDYTTSDMVLFGRLVFPYSRSSCKSQGRRRLHWEISPEQIYIGIFITTKKP